MSDPSPYSSCGCDACDRAFDKFREAFAELADRSDISEALVIIRRCRGVAHLAWIEEGGDFRLQEVFSSLPSLIRVHLEAPKGSA